MKEYVKLYWCHTSEKEADEPVIIIYEVDLKGDCILIKAKIAAYQLGKSEFS